MRSAIDALLEAGKSVAVTVADEEAELSPQQTAQRLGFSRQHVRRLIDAGEIEALRLPNSQHWRIPLRSILSFERRRVAADERAAEHSLALDRLGAPLE